MSLNIFLNSRFTGLRTKVLLNYIKINNIGSSDKINRAYFFSIYGTTLTGYSRDFGEDYNFYLGTNVNMIELLIDEIKYGKNELLQETIQSGYSISDFINHIQNLTKEEKEYIILCSC